MTDIYFPPDLVPGSMTFGIDDFTAVDESASSGVMQSSALYGTRRWRVRMEFPLLTRGGGQLGRFEALIAALRGRANRVWISPATSIQRGSFPGTELLTNGDFSNGIAGWGADAQYAVTAIERGIRATRAQVVLPSAAAYLSATKVANIPYCVRVFVKPGKGGTLVGASDFGDGTFGTLTTNGMASSVATTPSSGADTIGAVDQAVTGNAGNFFDLKYASLSRCALIDNAPNLFTNSDTVGVGTGWTIGQVTAGSVAGIGPDGSATIQQNTETAVSANHLAWETITIPATAFDLTISCVAKPGTRTWLFFSLFDSGPLVMWFNMSTGAIGTVTPGAFTNVRTAVVQLGNGWARYTLTVRKTSAATGITISFGGTPSDAVQTFLGVTGSPAIYFQRVSLALSSFPIRQTATGNTAVAAAGQTGNALYLKGLPASTAGLLLEGDLVEVVNQTNLTQLVRVTSSLDSDAAGNGYLQFENALKFSPGDNAGVVVGRPFGRFMLSGSNLGVEYSPGVFGSASLEFIESA